jgi:hypothetical protein
LGRIQQADGKVTEVRSPLPGKINQLLRENGAQVNAGDDILTLNSDEASVWEVLRGLSLIGRTDDLPIVRTYTNSSSVSARVKQQAILTANSIQAKK